MPTVGWLANWKREIKWKWYSFEIEFHRNAKNFTRRGPKKSVEVEWVKGEGGGGRHDWMMANWTRNYRIERAVNASVKVSLACSRDSNESEGEGVERRSQRGRRKRGTERKSEIENGRERETARESERARSSVTNRSLRFAKKCCLLSGGCRKLLLKFAAQSRALSSTFALSPCNFESYFKHIFV